MQYLSVIAIGLLIAIVTLETRFPLYLVQHPLLVRLTSNTNLLLVIGWLIALLYVVLSKNTSFIVWYAAMTLVAIIIRYVIFYGSQTDNFTNLAKAEKLYQSFLDDEPEMVVVDLSSHPNSPDGVIPQIVPTKYLTINDLVLTGFDLDHDSSNSDWSHKYSLTYCLLCNSIHAFVLPKINEQTVELTSNRGMVINGNKILTGSRGKYIWQQFTGEPISDPDLPSLIELDTFRLTWEQVRDRYSNARYFVGSLSPVSNTVFSAARKLVRTIPFAALSTGGSNHALGKKVPVVGVVLNDQARAYPLSLFGSDPVLLEDHLGDTGITLVHDGHGTTAFAGTGLHLDNQQLSRDELSWDLTGQALGQHDDLERLHVTDHAYWYLWNQFYPNTTVYYD